MLETLAPPVTLAAFGGIARACRHGARSWRQFCGSMVVSGFSGVVVHLLIRESSLSASLQAAIVAVSGYSGGAVLDAFASTLINKIKTLPESGKNKGENNG
jgi:hypothetical protein